MVLAGCDSGGSSNLAVTPTSTLNFQTLNLNIPQKALDAPIVGVVPDSQVLHVGVTFKIDPNTLKQLDNNGSDNSQSGDNLAQKLGISAQTEQAFKEYFGIEGATINLSKTRTWMNVDIKAGSLATLLQTKFVQHKLNNLTFYTPDPAHMPKVPTQLASQILAVTGLDNYSTPPHTSGYFQPMSTHQAKGAQVDCSALTNRAGWNVPILLPYDYINAYGLAPFQQKGWYGQGQKVLLVEPDDSYSQSDVNTFFQCANFKGSFNTVTVDGAPAVPNGSFDESTLDIDTIASVAPRAQIVDYQGDAMGAYQNGGSWGTVFNDLLQRIIDDYQNDTHSGTVVSISIGGGESQNSPNDMQAIDQSLQIMTQAEHMTVFVASGDCGAFEDRTYGQLDVSWPADDPWVVGVGGTMLSVNGNGNRTREVAWSDSTASQSDCNNSWGTGGGVSAYFQQPDYQQQNASSIAGLHNQYSTGYRQSPDIAAAATNNICYMQNEWGDCSGTSAATPLVASGTAVLNGAFRYNFKYFFFSPSIWYAAQAQGAKYQPLYDITQGDNLYYKAGGGWDYATGLGVPNFAGYYESLQLFIPKK